MTSTTCKQKQVDITEAETDYFYYRGQQLVNIIQGQGQSQPGQRFFQTATGLAAQMNVGGNAGTWLIGSDVLGSVLAGSDGNDTPEEHCYTPYGGEKHQGSTESVMKLGYTGAYRDPLTGLYPLGNGYRCYLPELMCFNKADSLSPFGAGGINTRSYCENDPINHSDPSGHIGKGIGDIEAELKEDVVEMLIEGVTLDPLLAVVGVAEAATEITVGVLDITEDAIQEAADYFELGEADAALEDIKKQDAINSIVKDLTEGYSEKSPIRSTSPETQTDIASTSRAPAPKRRGDDLEGPSRKFGRVDPREEERPFDHYDRLTVEEFIKEMYGQRDLPNDPELVRRRNYARLKFNEKRPELLRKICPDLGGDVVNQLFYDTYKTVEKRVNFSIELIDNNDLYTTIKMATSNSKTREKYYNMFIRKEQSNTRWF